MKMHHLKLHNMFYLMTVNIHNITVASLLTCIPPDQKRSFICSDANNPLLLYQPLHTPQKVPLLL